MSLVLCGVVLLGCGEEFTPASQVDGLRVLAIEASPPTIQCDVRQTFQELASGSVEDLSCSETAELQALVHSSSPIQWTWSACLFDTTSSNAFACADEALECCLSDEPTASFSLASLMLAIGSGACSDECTGSASGDLLAGVTTQGREDLESEMSVIGAALLQTGALIRLVVTSGGEKVEAVKSVRFAVEESPNSNPVIEAVELDYPGCPQPDGEGWCASADDEVVSMGAGETMRIRVSVTEDSEEDFIDVLGDSDREEMHAFWFATAGDISSEESYGRPAETEWTAPSAIDWPDGEVVQLWFVIRDGRGGVTWTKRTVERQSEGEGSGG